MLLKGLEEGRFDIVIGPISSVPDTIVREPLFREPLYLASRSTWMWRPTAMWPRVI